MKITTMIRMFISFAILFSAVSSYAETERTTGNTKNAFSLNDLYDIALEQAEQINIAREDLYIAQKDKTRARAALIPRFTVFGGYTVSDYELNTDPGQPTMPAEATEEKDALAWGVRFDQTFTLNGKEIIGYNISKDLIRKSNFDLTARKESYLYQVASAYYQVLRAAKAKEIATANVERLKTHRDAVEARLRLEEVTRTDMYRAESELSDAQAQLIEAGNQLTYAKATLKNLVSLPEQFKLVAPAEATYDESTPDLEVLKTKGLTMRSEVKAAKVDYSVSERSVKLSRGSYWPALSLEGQYAGSDASVDGSATYDQDSTGYEIGAKLTFTLFDGGLRGAEVSQSLAKSRQARLALDATTKSIILEVEGAFLNLENQKSKLTSLNDKLRFSTQNYKAVSEQFKYGLANSVDMMDANTLLVSAERELSDAQFGYRLARLNLNRATGTFLAEAGYATEKDSTDSE